MPATPEDFETLDVLTVDKPEQLKALGHPLRLRVLEMLGEDPGEALTNRELAGRIGVDPGHLHFHVRKLLKAGLIRLAGNDGARREKPYRAVARHITVAPELLSAGAASDVQTAFLEEVQRGFTKFAASGRFRALNDTVRIDPNRLGDLIEEALAKAQSEHDPGLEPIVLTAFIHPPATQE
jgi:DNA-binding transcriptional ArsR family regulator